MAQSPSPDSKASDLPTIIIDPSAYQPERLPLWQSIAPSVRRLSRVMLFATGVGGVTIGISQVAELDSLSLRDHVVALTTRFSPPFKERSAKQVGALSVETIAAPVLVAARVDPVPDVPQVVAPSAVAEPAGVLPESPVAEPLAAEPLAAEPVSAAPAAPVSVAQAVPVAPVAVAKPIVKHPLDIQEAVRNARRMLATNRLEEAEAAYRKVLAVSDNQPAALVGLARIQLGRGQLDEALAFAQRAAAEAPDQASSHLALGDVLRARGDQAAAQAQYAHAALRSASEASNDSAPRGE